MIKHLFRTSCLLVFLIFPYAVWGLSSSSSADVASISVMTFNIENGGTQVSFDNVVKTIKKAGADVVGLQEAWGNTIRLATALGWRYYNPRQHLISRFPLYETLESDGLYSYIEIRPGQYVAIANMHLSDEFYGPDKIRAGEKSSKIRQYEGRWRLPTALLYINKLSELAQKGIPVFLTGDFNSASHIDWVKNTVGKLPNHRFVVDWPVTRALQERHFIDSYRITHANPLKHPGYTWPAGRPYLNKTFDNFNPSVHDLPERIDFIFTAGKSITLESKILGEANNPDVNWAIMPWPSDHRAIVSRFEVTPLRQVIKNRISTSINNSPHKTPIISVSKQSVKTGEDFAIRWINAPANRYDYIKITASTSLKHPHLKSTEDKENSDQTICIYTNATVNGMIHFNQKNKKGNGVYCFGQKWSLPNEPGIYDIQLMEDDGFTVIAKTKVRLVV